jgi:hypothetical protein
MESTAPDTSAFPEVNSVPFSSVTEIELESPRAINSSAKVRETVDGKATTVELIAGSALANTVCAEAGSATNVIASAPAARRNFEIFMFAVYPR